MTRNRFRWSADSPVCELAGYSESGTLAALRWRDEEKEADVLKIKEQWQFKATCTDCGYFFYSIVA